MAAAAYKFADSGDLAMNSRLAADAVGATRMDRPEWSAVHPASGEIYYTLTNNANRKLSPTGSQQGLDAVNPKTGFAFIQTDDGAYTDVTNCMMLIGRTGAVGDGTTPTLTYTKADGSRLDITARVGAKPTVDTLRRFLVGPVDCEITGCAETPDGKTIFVNIQHPGEAIAKADIANPSRYLSHWPANAGCGAGGATTARPRSATIAIVKNDGGLIGS